MQSSAPDVFASLAIDIALLRAVAASLPATCPAGLRWLRAGQSSALIDFTARASHKHGQKRGRRQDDHQYNIPPVGAPSFLPSVPHFPALGLPRLPAFLHLLLSVPSPSRVHRGRLACLCPGRPTAPSRAGGSAPPPRCRLACRTLTAISAASTPPLGYRHLGCRRRHKNKTAKGRSLLWSRPLRASEG